MLKKKTMLFCLIPIAVLLVVFFVLYPHVSFKSDGKLYVCSYSDDFSEFEENPSYNEVYFYNEQRDLSLKGFEVKSFLCFYVLSFDYVEGDVRETQFMLEQAYIDRWLKNAVIKENPDNIDIAALIRDKQAIVGNKRYFDNDYNRSITYVLDGKWETLYVFESEGLTVIQVGSPDECPKFIAYR